MSIAIEALFLDLQLPIDTVKAVKFGTIGAKMGLIDHFFADKAGKDFHQASILLIDSSRYHFLHYFDNNFKLLKQR